jgi:hypothetical protein
MENTTLGYKYKEEAIQYLNQEFISTVEGFKLIAHHYCNHLVIMFLLSCSSTLCNAFSPYSAHLHLHHWTSTWCADPVPASQDVKIACPRIFDTYRIAHSPIVFTVHSFWLDNRFSLASAEAKITTILYLFLHYIPQCYLGSRMQDARRKTQNTIF